MCTSYIYIFVYDLRPEQISEFLCVVWYVMFNIIHSQFRYFPTVLLLLKILNVSWHQVNESAID